MISQRAVFGLLVSLVAFDIAAEDTVRTVRVVVTATAGRSVIIDQGRSAAIEPGQRVRFFPPGLGEMEGIVQNVSADSARVEFAPGLTLPPEGTQGEVDVLVDDSTDENKDSKEPGTPEHPPWSRELEVRGPDQPLLSPAFGLSASQRPARWDGRIFSQLTYNHDRGENRSSDFYLGRVGTWVTGTNLVGAGGRLLLAGEGSARGADIADVSDESEMRARLDRFSYAFGGHEYSAYRAEAGRFYSHYLPELGLVDGAEGALRFDNGITVGAGGGSYPVRFRNREEWDDYGFHTFVQYESDGDHHLTAILAYEKTWHKGEEDRDLVMARVNVKPTEKTWLYGLVKADIHDSSATLESDTVEISEAWVQARYVPDRKKGVSVSLSHYSWPQLMRTEYQSLPDVIFMDGYVDRGSINGWYRIRDNVRISARGNIWVDQDDSGGGGEVSANWTDINNAGTDLYGAVSYTSGSIRDGLGVRSEIRQRIQAVDLYAGYEIFQYTQSELLSGDEDFTRHTARAGLNWSHGNWYTSLNTDYYFGDGENAIGANLFLEYHF